MKTNNKFMLLPLIALMGIGLTGCGDSPSSTTGSSQTSDEISQTESSDTSEEDNSTDTTTDSKTEGETSEDHWHKDENDFNSDPDTEHTTVEKDETPIDKGEKKSYRFEMENSYFDGKTKRDKHLCLFQSYAFSPEASGNFILKNINAGTMHTFKFTSDKAVKIPAVVKIARKSNTSVAGEYNMLINGKDWVYAGASIDVAGKVPAGLNPTYFTMVEANIELSIKKGLNELNIIHNSSDCANLDYIELKTSANIIDKTDCNQPDLSDAVSIVKMPTNEAGGVMRIGCKVEPNHATSGQNYNIPALSDKTFYSFVDNEKTTSYQANWGNKKFDVISSNLLTLTGGAKFKDGTTSKKFFKDQSVEIDYTVPAGKGLIGWKNVNNETETYPSNFVMPNKPISIAPILKDVAKYKLTLVNATFEDGSTSKDVSAFTKPVIKTQPDANKRVIGWYDVDSKEIFNNPIFEMPEKAIKIAPLFGADEFKGTSFGKVDIGRKKLSFEPGYIESGFVKNQIVGDELGIIAKRDKMDVGNKFCIETSGRVDAKLKFTTTFINMGNSEITFIYNQFDSFGESELGKPTSRNVICDAISLKPGEEITLIVESPVDWHNNNTMFRVIFTKLAVNVKLGMYQYAEKI